MFNFNVNKFNDHYNFMIKGVSNVQYPKSNTMMFVGNKLKRYLKNLDMVKECLVFIENGILVDQNLLTKHCFIESKNPAFEYVKTLDPYVRELYKNYQGKKYTHTAEEYLIGEGVQLGKNTIIEPGCIIDHRVKIGDNTIVLSGAIIRSNVIIGKNCIVKEKAVIGSYGFTFTKDENGNNIRIPSLGGVVIGDNVEVGAFATVCSGTACPTSIGDYVKIDDHVHIGHDVIIGRNTSIAASSVIAGYVQLGEKVYIGAGASIKNRIIVGNNAVIGMAARVYKNVKEKQTVLNEPAVTMDEMIEKTTLISRLRTNKKGEEC